MSANIMKPTINLNGTSPAILIEDRIHALRMVTAAREAIGELAPNGRDYIGKPDELKRDQEIHRERFQFLDDLYNALEDEVHEIANGGAA